MRILLFLLLFPTILLSQQKINANIFLGKTIEKYGLSDFEVKNQENPRFPLFEKLEFRTETHEFIREEREYMFRLTPSTDEKRKAQEDLYNRINQKPNLEREKYLCDLSFELQKDWLSLWYYAEARDINLQMFELNENLDSIYSMSLENTDLNELIKLRQERNDLGFSIKKYELQYNELCNLYGIDQNQIDFSNILSLENLIKIIGLKMAYPIARSIRNLDFDLSVKELEHQLENSENHRILDFMQLQYQGPKTDPYAERISFGVGFILPNSGNRKIKLKELEIEAEELRMEKEMRILREERERSRMLASIYSDFELYQYKTSSQQKEKENYLALRSVLFSEGEIDIDSYQDMEERVLKNQFEILQIKLDLYKDILDYMHDTEILCSDVQKSALFQD